MIWRVQSVGVDGAGKEKVRVVVDEGDSIPMACGREVVVVLSAE